MKILVTGANGQLGRELCRQLERGGSSLGPVPTPLAGACVIPADIEQADLSRQAEADALVGRCAPDAVVNCAAFTKVDAAESERDAAFASNAVAPRNLAMACEAAGAKLVHISTDYVFGGEASSPIPETCPTAPQSVYGATKLLGEAYVRQFCGRWFIVRTAWLYGVFGQNFVKTILRLAAEREEVRVVDDQLGSPTNAEDLAHHILRLVPTREYGLYHCAGGGVCSWYAFAREIARLGGARGRILPCTTREYPSPVRRPAYSALDNAMLRATVGDGMRPWQEALAAYFKQAGEIT